MSSRPPERNARLWVGIAALLILVITIAHFSISTHHTAYHDLLRRLYYVPVLMIALVHGLRGGLAAALVVALIYTPHAFLVEHHLDPSPAANKLLEMAFFFLIGGLVGARIDRERGLASELMRSEDERRAIQRSLDRAARLAALGELTAGLAHEIRNPLASIKGASEILADDFEGEHPKKRLAEILLRETDRLNTVLQRFLTFARPDRAELRPTKVGALVVDTVALVLKQAEQANVELSARVDEHLPMTHADGDQLRQLLLNLILNAVQAVKSGGHVWVEAHARDQELVIDVSDDGPGVPESERDHIFDPFVSHKEGGTGLGLAISLRIVEAHDGWIHVSDREPHGTRFSVHLPIRTTDASDDQTLHSADR